MLLVVVDDEKPQDQQPAQNTGRHFAQVGGKPKCAGQSAPEESDRGEDVPPTLKRHVRRESSGRLNQIKPGARGRCNSPIASRPFASQPAGFVGGQ